VIKPEDKTYLAFGVRILTPFPLPDLPEVTGSHDVIIREGEVTDTLVDSLFDNAKLVVRPGARFGFAPGAIYLEWDLVGRVLLKDGNEVIVQRDAEASMDDLGPFLTGPVLAVLLHQRKYFVLHASSVEIDGGAAVFVGPKGFGKSTLAAHMEMRGHRLISDDIVPLRSRSGEVCAEPGFPRVKLFDDAIEALGASPSDFPPIHRFATKRSLNLTGSCDQEPVPLRAIYILNEEERFAIVEMSKPEAFIEIMRNAHLGKFLEETGRQSSYFELCGEIANKVRVFRLDRPSSFEEMPRILDELVKHAEGIVEKNQHLDLL
jgi:hypothetical protein